MKKIITTLAVAFVMSSYAQPQTKQSCCEKKPSPNAELISQNTKGGYKICKWRVAENNADQKNEFDVRYNINASQMTKGYDGNDKSLSKVHMLFDTITDCRCTKITKVTVVGYASPDGNKEDNKELAYNRADNFYKYISNEYNLSEYPSEVTGKALSWSGIKSGVLKSDIPNKSEVVDIITSRQSNSAIEAKLRAMPTSWSYLCKNVLPMYRNVELHISYQRWKYVTTRTPIQPEQIAVVEEVVIPQYYIIMPPTDTEIIAYENPHSTDLDYDIEKGRYSVKDRRGKEKEREDIKNLWGTIKGRYKLKR